MSEYTRQDTEALRITIRKAAYRLGVTEAAIRKRIQRGSLEKELGSDGRVYVYLDLGQDISHPTSQVHRDPMVNELVEELKDRGAFLERRSIGRVWRPSATSRSSRGSRRPTSSPPS